MAEERVPLEGLDDGGNAVVPADAEVVPLGDVVGQDDLGVLADTAHDREEHVLFERLCLVHDHEGVMERTSADVGQRHDFQHAPVHDFFHDFLADERTESVEDRLRPGVHLLRLGTGKVAKFLSTHRIQGAEDDHFAVLPALQDGLESGAQGEGRLSRTRAASDRDDSDAGIHEQIDRKPLLRRAAVQSEDIAVPLDQPHLFVRAHASQGGAPVGKQHQSRVDGQLRRRRDEHRFMPVQGGDFVLAGFDLRHPGPAGVLDEFIAVFVREQPHRGGFDAHRKVLGDDRDVAAFVGEVLGDCQDAAVVVRATESCRKHFGGHMVHLNAQRAAVGSDRDGLIQSAMLDAQVIQEPEGLAGEVAQLGIVAFALQFGDDHDRDNDFVLREAQQGVRIGKQDGSVNHIAPASRGPGLCSPPAVGPLGARGS